jgi:hypothetical protein
MWNKGTIDVCWTDSYQSLPFEREPIQEYEIKKWRMLGYTHDSFSGKMYSSRNPMPDWVNDVALDLKLSKCGFVIYKMSTLEIMPVHVDHYHTYCKVFDVDRADVVRTIVFLEDWKPGHYSEIDGVGITNWKAGDYIQWQADVPHAAANIGIAPRYTLQITGVLEHEL